MRKIVLLVGALLVSSFNVVAEPAKSAKQANSAIQFRQALLQLVRSNVGALGGMAKGAIPMDRAKIEKNASRIEQLSLMMSDYFVLDTRGFNVPTDALDKVWESHDDFESKIVNLTKAAANLKAAAQSGEDSELKPAIGKIFNSCKSCHDDYKAE